MGRVFRRLQIDTGPRRSPSACSGTFQIDFFQCDPMDDVVAGRLPTGDCHLDAVEVGHI